MAAAIGTAIETFSTDLTTLAGDVYPVAGVALLAFVGWRLACKLINRGVGK